LFIKLDANYRQACFWFASEVITRYNCKLFKKSGENSFQNNNWLQCNKNILMWRI